MVVEAIIPAPRATWVAQRLERLLGQLQGQQLPILRLRLELVQLLDLVSVKLAMQQLRLLAGAALAEEAAKWVAPVEIAVDADTPNT
jgi:hypothetical protein